MHGQPEPAHLLGLPSGAGCRQARPLPLAAAAAWVGLARCHHARDNDDV